MKKIILILLLVLTLTACADTEDQVEEATTKEVMFNGDTYQYLNEIDNYDRYINNNGHIIEINYGYNTTLTTEIDEDIYIITGTKINYSITKNGETILYCIGEELTCTGFENKDFKEDFVGIIEMYEEE